MRLPKSIPHHKTAGGTILESIFAVAISGIFFSALFAGITSGMFAVQSTREDLRATQIITEKFETIRLYSWDQITTPGFIPSTFSAPFHPKDEIAGGVNEESPNPVADGTIIFNGTVTISKPPSDTHYTSDLRQVEVQLVWQTGSRMRTNSATTLVSRYGLQNYIY